MRKVFWCGTLLTVAVTAAVYWTGVYAGRHPETLLGQCTGVIYEGRSCPRSCTGDLPGCEDSDLCSPEEPQAIVEQLPDQPEPIDLYKSASEPVQEFSASIAPLPAPETAFPPVPVADADEDRYKIMPLCEDGESDAPDLMPYATDRDARGLQETSWLGIDFKADSQADVTWSKRFGFMNNLAFNHPDCPTARVCHQIVWSSGLQVSVVQVAGDHAVEQHSVPSEPSTPTAQPTGTIKPSNELPRQPLPEKGHPRTTVDTMEFRPTDAKRGEFEKAPF